MSEPLQQLIDNINNQIKELLKNGVTIDDYDNPTDWRLSHIEWDKENDRIWFRTEVLK